MGVVKRNIVIIVSAIIITAYSNTSANALHKNLYPQGMCDTIADGMPGLSDNTRKPQRIEALVTLPSGNTIWAEYWGKESADTVYVVVAQVHGDECSPSLLVDEIRKHPPTSYGVWLIPTLNPDGYANYTRKNANGIDLNDDGYMKSQQETQALLRFVAKVKPALVLHFHSPNAFVGAHGGKLASQVGRRIADATGFLLKNAGEKQEKNKWRLWQGLETIGYQSVLVELHAVSWKETPGGDPRPKQLNVEQVRTEIRAVLGAL